MFLPRLLKALETQPRTQCYFASGTTPGSPYGSGCGYIISSDLAKMIVKDKNQIYDALDWDDVKVGQFFIARGIKLRPALRLNFSRAEDWDQYKNKIDPNVFHFRIKNDNDVWRSNEKVYADDIYIHYDMLNTFYFCGVD